MNRIPSLLCLLPLLLLSCEDESHVEHYTTESFRAAVLAANGDIVFAGGGANHSYSVATDRLDDSPVPPDGNAYLVRVTSTGEPVWERSYDVGPFGTLQAVRELPDGSLLAMGHFMYDYSAGSVFLLKADGQGNELWKRTVPTDLLLYPSAFRALPDGFLMGGWNTEPYTSMRVVRISDDGDLLLDRTYSDLAYLKLHDALATDSGYVLLCRHEPQNLIYLIGTDSAGDTLWTRTVGTAFNESQEDLLTADPAGGYLVTGADGRLRFLTGSGALRSELFLPTDRPRTPLDAQPAGDGFLLAGNAAVSGTPLTDFFVQRLDPTGAVVWTRDIDISSYDNTAFVLPLSDGAVLGGFVSAAGRRGYDACAIRVDAGGNGMWTSVFGQ